MVAIMMSQARSIIDLKKVVKTYKNAAGEFQALKGIDLTLYQGEFVSIIGKSGSGKSTLLNMVTGIDFPTSGLVHVNDVDIYSMNESQRSLWRGKNLGIVFQFFQLLPMLTLLENVMLPMDYINYLSFDERPKRALELLDMVGLAKFANKLPIAVSTGQQQSAAIARSLATDPPLIVADEPTGNLDSRSTDNIIHLFEQLVEEGRTIAMVTHDPSLTSRTSRNIVIADGLLINEAIVRAFPLLTHKQMLEVTKLLEFAVYEPCETIIKSGEHIDSFFLIQSGTVEVVLLGSKKEDITIARLTPGQFFGEIELMRGGKTIANVRAGPETPVELALLPGTKFNELLQQSPLTREALSQIVQDRIQENRMSDRRTSFLGKLFGGGR
jgi:ABC-type lipoprotein export system ATPase subunit